ncbi:MAG: Smr/MutS family protein, partial [Lachnospiraceae bacterium]|nr:Smr/MutS family protein [Lachnospiraceae bacterium]
PSSNENNVKRLLKETSEAVTAIEKAGRPPLAGLTENDDIPLMKRLAAGATLGTRDLLSVSALLASTRELKSYREKAEVIGDGLSDYFEALDPLPSLEREITRCIIGPDEIADDASPELKECRKKIASLNNKVKDSLQRMLSTYAELLSDALITTRDDRFVLPVRAEFKSRVPGIVHGASATGQTLYIEPMQAVEANNAIREEEEKEADEIRRILASLSASCAVSKEIIEGDSRAVTALDFIFARAGLAEEMRAVQPEILSQQEYSSGLKSTGSDRAPATQVSDTGAENTHDRRAFGRALKIEAARHPLLDPEKAVPIDIEIGGDYRILIITGPNTGGKTVSLKTLGLLSIMAQTGLFAPARIACLPVFGEVFADIGDPQSIEESLSTFSGHMKNIIYILRHAGENDLVLFDELCAGTDPAEGAALATAILDYIKGRRVSAMLSTHYAELKSYALTTEGVQNASMEFDEETLSPTYRLIIGLPGKSNALAIAKRLGIPASIISEAKNNMGTEQLSLEDLLGNLERERRRAQSEADTVRHQNEILESRLEKLQEKEKKFEKQREDILKKANEKAANILADAKSQYDSAIRDLNKAEKAGVADRKAMENKRRELGEKTKGKRSKAAVKPAPAAGKKPTPESIEIGDFVKVLSMGGVIGTVHSLPDRKGNLEVKAGILTTKVNISDLEAAEDSGVSFEGADVAGKRHIKGVAARNAYGRPAGSNRNGAGWSAAGGNSFGGSSGSWGGYSLSFEGDDSGTELSSFSKAATISPEVKLIGMTTDEALMTLDKYLDDAVLAGLSSCRIVHGKGAGILRNAVQDYLRRDGRVRSYHTAEFGEGDAGVTIAEL